MHKAKVIQVGKMLGLTGAILAIALVISAWTTLTTVSTGPKHIYDSYPAASQNGENYVIAAKWDKLNVTYSFINCPASLDCETAKQVVRDAAETWDSACGLSLSEIGAEGDIRIGWFSGAHGDGEPFDGPGNILAHAFFPKAFIGDLAGDLHFDNDEHWVAGSGNSPFDVDLGTVALHELGHSLGLDHSADPNSVMWAEYTGKRSLAADDIAGIQALYGPPSPNEGASIPTPSATGVTARTTSPAKIRSGPGTTFGEIGKVPENTTVDVLGRNGGSDWLFVDYSGIQGWSAGWLYAVNGDVASLPVLDGTGGATPPTEPPTQPPAGGGVTATTVDSVKMRQGPDINFPEIGKIPNGTTVNVLARTQGYNWILVEYQGLQGWAAAWLFQIHGSLADLPVQ